MKNSKLKKPILFYLPNRKFFYILYFFRALRKKQITYYSPDTDQDVDMPLNIDHENLSVFTSCQDNFTSVAHKKQIELVIVSFSVFSKLFLQNCFLVMAEINFINVLHYSLLNLCISIKHLINLFCKKYLCRRIK